LAGLGARQMVREGDFWTDLATFRRSEGLYTPPAWMTPGQTPHAFGVDDTLLLAFTSSCSWCLYVSHCDCGQFALPFAKHRDRGMETQRPLATHHSVDGRRCSDSCNIYFGQGHPGIGLSKKLFTPFCRDGKRSSSIRVINGNSITNRHGIFGRMHFCRHCEEKHHVVCGFLPIGGDATPSGNIDEVLVRRPSVRRQRQWRCTEFHSTSLSIAIPGWVLPCAVLFPNCHPGKVAPAKTVAHAQVESPIDGQQNLYLPFRVQLYPGQKALPLLSERKSQIGCPIANSAPHIWPRKVEIIRKN
jgi:hypothetical protein